MFTDPAVRSLYADWDTVARTAVAQLRMEAARYPGDPRLTALVGELSVQDPRFRQWWAAHHVAARTVGTKALHHPVAGDLTLGWDTLTASTDPDQQLVMWTAEPGTPSHDGLRILASWAADQQQPAPAPRADSRGATPTHTHGDHALRPNADPRRVRREQAQRVRHGT